MKNFKLCYIESKIAYFTTQPLEQQWGDDWDDAPYEHNAGPPHECHEDEQEPWEIQRVAFSGDFMEPSSLAINRPYSVEDINAGSIPWLQDRARDHQIWAGDSITRFQNQIWRAGGSVFREVPPPFKRTQ